MEKRIRAYEKYIARELSHEMSEKEKTRLIDFHREMMANFQHERLMHLIVTLFFAVFAIVAVFVTAWTISIYGVKIELLTLYILTIILVILTGFYVRHYYFLENHIQNLYEYTEKLMK